MSRRNALRHGLTAETVIDGLEDTDDYRAFETAITSDYNAEAAVERELELRLAVMALASDHSNRDRSVSDPGRNLA